MKKKKHNKILIISDALKPPDDEGIKKFSQMFVKRLKEYNGFQVEVVSLSDKPFLIQKTFLFSSLRNHLKKASPHTIFYIPRACGTLLSLARTVVLHYFSPQSKIALFSLQYRALPSLLKKVCPKGLKRSLYFFTFEKEYEHYLSSFGFKATMVAPGVDLERFSPPSREEKRRLRKKWKIPVDRRVGLHVGHIKRERGLELLLKLRRRSDLEILLIGSSTFPVEIDLKKQLEENSIRIELTYVENIEEAYQLSDLYLFPTSKAGAVIDMPMSVLEAMATNLPVVTFPIGTLKYLSLHHEKGVYIAENDEDFIAKTEQALKLETVNTRSIAEEFTWDTTIERVICFIGIW